MGALMETPEGEIVIVPLDDDNKRRLAARMALGMYAHEPCRICRRLIEVEDLHDLVFAGYSRDGKTRAAHKVCWDNFVELLQTLPPARLYELVNDLGKESDADGQRTDSHESDRP